jgi:hypothetical protein
MHNRQFNTKTIQSPSHFLQNFNDDSNAKLDQIKSYIQFQFEKISFSGSSLTQCLRRKKSEKLKRNEVKHIKKSKTEKNEIMFMYLFSSKLKMIYCLNIDQHTCQVCLSSSVYKHDVE